MENISTIMIQLCSSVGLSGLIMFFVTRHYKKKDDLADKRTKEEETTVKTLQEFSNKFETICSTMIDFKKALDDVKAELQAQSISDEHNSSANRDLLRNAMLSIYEQCYEVNGYITVNQLENFEHLYVDYKALNGNGMIDGLREKINKLPTVKPQ